MTEIAVCTVTFGSRRHLPGYFDALAALEPSRYDYRVVLVDCGSDDGSAEEARRLAGGLASPVDVIELDRNLGFAGGMNAALEAAAGAPLVMSLNPDARPSPGALARLADCRAELDRETFRVGAVTGRLVRPAAGSGGSRLDACGMRLRATWRHLDRGSDEPERGQYRRRVEVFGGTGAATLYDRSALDDVAVDGEIFDASFHSFREDAELCFRLRERGWHVVYEPEARIEHERYNLPHRRREMPAAVNYHSLKNRYLLRLLHQSPANLLLTLLPTALRDLGILAYALLRERRSLPAYTWIWQHRHRIRERRQRLRRRRLVGTWAVDRWFFLDHLPLPTTPDERDAGG